MTDEQIPDVYGELTGYRAWRVRRDGALTALAVTVTPPGCTTEFYPAWNRDVNGATCLQPLLRYYPALVTALMATGSGLTHARHEPPGDDCRCGFYAVTDPWAVSWQLGAVTGAVALWGDVIPHEAGYRAARARILAVTCRWPRTRRAIRSQYPELKIYWTRTALVHRYPPRLLPGQDPLPGWWNVNPGLWAGALAVAAGLFDVSQPFWLHDWTPALYGAALAVYGACVSVRTARIRAGKKGKR